MGISRCCRRIAEPRASAWRTHGMLEGLRQGTPSFTGMTMISTSTAENLFLILYGLCLAAVTTTTLRAIFPYGVGHIFTEGVPKFLIRAAYIFFFLLLCSVAFILGLQFCKTASPRDFISSAVCVLLIMFLSLSPWFCDHLARIFFLPANKTVKIRESKFKYVDVVFVIFYLLFLAILFLGWKMVR